MANASNQSQVNIRFSDVDAFGHVNNAVYLTYFEEARVAFFDEIVDYGYDWSKQGVILARFEIDYLQPVHFKEEVFIRTACARIGNKSFDLTYEMYKIKEHKEITLCTACSVMVMFDYEKKVSIEVPESWKLALSGGK
jgi:acyl-CoA thioester hydrolase